MFHIGHHHLVSPHHLSSSCSYSSSSPPQILNVTRCLPALMIREHIATMMPGTISRRTRPTRCRLTSKANARRALPGCPRTRPSTPRAARTRTSLCLPTTSTRCSQARSRPRYRLSSSPVAIAVAIAVAVAVAVALAVAVAVAAAIAGSLLQRASSRPRSARRCC